MQPGACVKRKRNYNRAGAGTRKIKQCQSLDEIILRSEVSLSPYVWAGGLKKPLCETVCLFDLLPSWILASSGSLALLLAAARSLRGSI